MICAAIKRGVNRTGLLLLTAFSEGHFLSLEWYDTTLVCNLVGIGGKTTSAASTETSTASIAATEAASVSSTEATAISTTATTETTATATATTTSEATSTATTGSSRLGDRKVQSDSSSLNLLSDKGRNGLGSISRVGKLDVSKALWTISLGVLCNTDSCDFTGLLEEIPDGLFSGTEAQVSAEDGVRFTGGTGDGFATLTGLVSREPNLEGISVEVFTVAGCLSLCCFLVGAVLDESTLLSEEMLALGKSSEGFEQFANRFFPCVLANVAYEKLGLSFVFGGHVGGNCLNFSRCCLFLNDLLIF